VPNDRKAAIRADLIEAQHALMHVLRGLGPNDWARQTQNEDWTVHNLLTHLTTAEAGFVPALRRMAAGEGGVPADFDPNRWNAGQLRRRGDVAPEQLLAELETSHLEMLSLLEDLNEHALEHRGNMSSGEDGSTEDNFRLVARHKREHTDQIRAAIGSSVSR
jgi:uncharacterized protein (TIGR03083 family)